jgi:hypothetical protein
MSRAGLKIACLLLFIFASSFSVSAFAFTPPWYYGPINPQIGTDTACLSSPPIIETRVAGYSGYNYWPPYQPSTVPFAQLPAIGETFYAKLVLSHPGNPCAGSAVGIELLLPAGVTTAISADNPVFCFARTPPNASHPSNYLLINLGTDPGYGCPQAFPPGLEGQAILAPNGGAGGGSWGMAAEFWLEFLVPLKSSVGQNGANQIYFRINPDLGVVGYTNVGLYVNSDTIFRSPMEDMDLTLDICTLTPTAQGC